MSNVVGKLVELNFFFFKLYKYTVILRYFHFINIICKCTIVVIYKTLFFVHLNVFKIAIIRGFYILFYHIARVV